TVDAGFELGQPRTQTGRLFRALLQDGTGPLHQESSQVRVPPFANPQQLLLAASGVFARDDSEPRGKPSPFFESCSIADRGVPPCRKVIPRSSSKPRIWLMTAVRRITQRSRTRCRDCRSSWSSVLIATKRIFGRPTASAIASASM